MSAIISNEVFTVPLNRLVPSPLNARADSPRKEDVAVLAADIRTRKGLLHNLVVHEIKLRKKVVYGVCAGRHRFEALRVLADAGEISKAFAVPVRCVPDAEARAASLSENKHRVAMHPADEFASFRKCIDDGCTVEETAAMFGVTPAVVERRLKLANVAPRLLDLYRSDDISIDQLMALTLARDVADQERIWDTLPEWDRRPEAIRRALTDGEVNLSTDPVAKFVGRKAYEKAGGACRGDMFDEQSIYAQDAALLNSLARAKLEKSRQKLLESETWAWVETRLQFDYTERAQYPSVRMMQRAATDEEEAQRQDIQNELDQLSESDSASEADFDRQDVLEDQLRQLEASLEAAVPEEQAAAGVIIYVDHQGRIAFARNVLKPEDAKQLRKNRKGGSTSAPGLDANAGDDQGGRPLSERLSRELTGHYTSALQLHVAKHPQVALAATVYALSVAIERNADQLFKLEITRVSPECEAVEFGEAAKRVADLLATRVHSLPPAEERLTYLLTLDQATLLELLAVLTASAIDARSGDSRTPKVARLLAQSVALDMREWWKATAESYLNHVPRDKAMEAAREAMSEQQVIELAKHKTKAAVVKAIEPSLVEARWVPAFLR